MTPQEQADELYKRGLLLFSQPLDKRGLVLLTQLWEEALKLYREIGNEIRVKEIESVLARLYKCAAGAKHRYEEKTHEQTSQPLPAESEPAAINSNFNEWGLFAKIGCYGFGGPMAVFSLLRDELVIRKKILTDKDFLEGAVLGDILPGPVTMDIVTYTGYKLKKWTGAFLSTLLFILPSFILMIFLAIYYDSFIMIPKVINLFKCLGAAVVGIIISVGLKLGEGEIKDFRATGILIWAFMSSLVFKFDIIVVVGFAGLAGILLYLPPPRGFSFGKKKQGVNEEV